MESPFQYAPKSSSSGNTELSRESAKYALNNDYSGFLSKLMKIPDESMQVRFGHYLTVLKAVEMAYPSSISEFKDAALLIWMIEISHSDYFKDWPKVKEWTEAVLAHFKDMSEGKIAGLHEAKPATKLDKGYTVLHSKFGRGIVRSMKNIKTTTRRLFVTTQIAALGWVTMSYLIALYATVRLGQVFPVVDLSEQAIETILGVNVLKVVENIFEHNDGAVFGKSNAPEKKIKRDC